MNDCEDALIVILSEAKDLKLIKMTSFFGRFAPSE
jgi:hypothetical protein